MLRVATRLETIAAAEHVVPFVIDRGDGTADCGFAASRWVIETLQWANGLDEPYRGRVRGLLFGYSAFAIQDFEQRQSIRSFTWSPGQDAN